MKRRKTGTIIVLMAIVMAMLAVTFTNAKAAENKIKLNTTNKTMYMDSTIKLRASVKGKVTWKSSDKKVAIVDKKGNVHAINKGKAVITAKLAGSKSKAKCVVTVKAAKAKVTLNVKSKTVYVKDKIKLKAKVSVPKGVSKNVKWISDNKKVATVDNKGNVKAISVGITTIRAISMANNKEAASCVLTVNSDDSERVNAYTLPNTSFTTIPSTVKSYGQLMEVMANIKKDNSALYEYVSGILSKYNEDFFKKNWICVSNYTHSSSEEIRYGKAERKPNKNGKYVLHITMTDLEDSGDKDYIPEPYNSLVFIECPISSAKKISRIEIDFVRGLLK